MSLRLSQYESDKAILERSSESRVRLLLFLFMTDSLQAFFDRRGKKRKSFLL
jgi:hypothetical protein